MANGFVHLELNTTDVDKAKDFYGKLFGWSYNEMPMPEGNYAVIKVEQGPGGGIMKHPMPGAPSLWLPYVSVSDVKASTKKAESMGAKILRDVTEVKDMGYFSILNDPTGATIGLWENIKKS